MDTNLFNLDYVEETYLEMMCFNKADKNLRQLKASEGSETDCRIHFFQIPILTLFPPTVSFTLHPLSLVPLSSICRKQGYLKCYNKVVTEVANKIY